MKFKGTGQPAEDSGLPDALPDAVRLPGPRRFILESLLLFGAFCLVLGLISAYVYNLALDSERQLIEERSAAVLETARSRYEGDILTVVSDVAYLAASQSTRRWLEDMSPENRDELAQNFLAVVANKKIYDQLRVIAVTGDEVVRVNYNDGDPVIVAGQNLQNKADRPYFQEAVHLAPGQSYLSPFDLNVENGVVETPHKPVLRVIVPLFDRSGQRRGFVVANYLGSQLLRQIAELDTLSPGDLWLVNDRGDWLRGPVENQWTFMYPESGADNFADKFPQAWSRMLESPSMGLIGTDGDLIAYTHVNAVIDGLASTVQPVASSLFLVDHVSGSVLKAARMDMLGRGGAFAAAFIFLFAVIALAVASIRQRARIGEARDAAQQNDLQFRSIIEAAPDPVLVVDRDGHIVFTNDPVARMFGYEKGALIGKPVELLVPFEARDRHVDYRTRYVQKPRNRQMGVGLDLEAVRADGSRVPVDVSLGYADTGAGRLVIATVRDMTDMVERGQLIERYAERLAHDNNTLKAVNEELEAFSYSVSHDLRAPLRAIDGFSQALIDDYGDRLDETGRSYAERVRKGAQRMGELIDDLLTLSRISRSEIRVEKVDLSEMAREVFAALQDREPSRDVECVIEDGVVVTADSRLIRIALENLLGNAWKFSAKTEGACIWFGSEICDGASAFYVRDNGAGYDPRYADKLFNAFQRLHDRRDFPGTGIGLAITQRIVNRHGGRIWSDSTPGEGAIFRIAL